MLYRHRVTNASVEAVQMLPEIAHDMTQWPGWMKDAAKRHIDTPFMANGGLFRSWKGLFLTDDSGVATPVHEYDWLVCQAGVLSVIGADAFAANYVTA